MVVLQPNFSGYIKYSNNKDLETENIIFETKLESTGSYSKINIGLKPLPNILER